MSTLIKSFDRGTSALQQGAKLRVNADGSNLRGLSGFEKIGVAFQRTVLRRSPEQLGTSDAAIAKALVGLYRSEHGGGTRLEIARKLGQLGLGRLADHLANSPSLESRTTQLEPEVDDVYQSLDEIQSEVKAQREEIFGTVKHAPIKSGKGGQIDRTTELPNTPEKAVKVSPKQRQEQAVSAGKAVTQKRMAAASTNIPSSKANLVTASAASGKANSSEAQALFAAIRAPGFDPSQYSSKMAPILVQRLGRDTAAQVMNPMGSYYSHLGDAARYKDIAVPTHSAVKLGDGKIFHASKIPNLGGLSDITIATQAPKSNTMQDFVRMTQEQGVTTIVDLTNSNDKTSRKIPDYGRDVSHGFMSIDQTTEELRSINLEKRQLQAKDGEIGSPITYLNFTNWIDKKTISSDQFHSLIEAIAQEHGKKSGGITIHCTAGVGRTGTVFAGLELHRMAQSGELRQDNFMDKVLDVVAQGRMARGHAFVQTSDQLNMLYEFAQWVAH